MREKYTIIPILLVFVWSFFYGPGLAVSSGQSDCGIKVANWNVLPTEKVIKGVAYKTIQVVVNNPNPGLSGRFWYSIDGAKRDTSTKFYEYGYQTGEILVPVTAQKITFYDFNINTCSREYTPNFTPNICTFNVDADIDLSEDCYHRTVTFSVHDTITIDSVAWIRNGGSVPVNDQMIWSNIPPGSYKIFFYDDRGCEATSTLSTCTTRTEAGGDHTQQYCIGTEDTINLFEVIDPNVDSGGFYTESFAPVDSVTASQLTFQDEGEVRYYYIAPAGLEIPDTSLVSIDVRDCSVCGYELVSAQRFCSDPETVEVIVGGGSPEDTTFLVTLPDGTSVKQNYFTPFQFDFPGYGDTLRLPVHMDTPTGVCDSILKVGVIPNPMVRIMATEVLIPGDSVGISIAAGQGTAPYQIDVFLGSQQKFVELDDNENTQLDFLQNVDTAYIIAMDDGGCMGTDTLLLTPDCALPEVVIKEATCGEENAEVRLDPGSVPDGSTITWNDVSEEGLWQRTGLSPGIYSYKVDYDQCQVTGAVTVPDSSITNVDIATYNTCLLDGQARLFIPDSSQVLQWTYGNKVLPYFSGNFPVNTDHVFYVETINGCLDTITVRADEPHWLNQVAFQEPKSLSALMTVDLNQLTDFGWQFQDSVLCHRCGDYVSEAVLKSGAYTFYAEQSPGCRNDTTITINLSEHQFLMPNVITPGGNRNNLIQIFDPLNQMASIMEFQVYDRFGNILYEKFDFYPDDDSTLNWPNGMTTELPDIIVCIAKIKCKEGDEVTMAQDVLILR